MAASSPLRGPAYRMGGTFMLQGAGGVEVVEVTECRAGGALGFDLVEQLGGGEALADEATRRQARMFQLPVKGLVRFEQAVLQAGQQVGGGGRMGERLHDGGAGRISG